MVFSVFFPIMYVAKRAFIQKYLLYLMNFPNVRFTMKQTKQVIGKRFVNIAVPNTTEEEQRRQ